MMTFEQFKTIYYDPDYLEQMYEVVQTFQPMSRKDFAIYIADYIKLQYWHYLDEENPQFNQ